MLQVRHLSAELDGSQAALQREQAGHSSSLAQLSEVQQALDQAQLELSDMHLTHEEDEARQRKLQDKLHRANSALQVSELGLMRC